MRATPNLILNGLRVALAIAVVAVAAAPFLFSAIHVVLLTEFMSMLVLAMVWLGSRPTDTVSPVNNGGVEQEAQVMSDLPVLENLDVLSNFDALSDLPSPVSDDSNQQQPDSNTEM